ncbi:MAG: hypothetical protein ACKVU1_01835 [bacterium]
MRKAVVNSLAFVAAMSFAALAHSPGFAQSTTFTYQGLLDDAGAPTNGFHDFRFRLFDAASGGAQIGAVVCVDNVSVTEGVFTAQLDFGQQYATTAQRYLEIGVRLDTGLTCADATGLVVLSPRQQLTATPLASHANAAFALDAADGSPANAVFVDNSGNVGMGTTTPATTLHVKTNGEGLRIDGSSVGASSTAWIGFRDANGTRTGYVGDGGGADNSVYLTSDAGDVHLEITSLGAVLTAKSDGKVGIGTTSPVAKLDVRGDIRLGPSGEFRATAGEENLRIIRGRVSAAGGLLGGSGFTVERTALGNYTVTFSQAFTGIPTVTATTVRDLNLSDIIAIDQVTSAAVSFDVINDAVNGFVDTPFHFTAIGPR